MARRTRSKYCADGALRLADRHAVVVEDHEELALERAGVVEAFHRDAVDDRGVADQRNDAAAVGINLGSNASALSVSPRAMPTAVEMPVPACPTLKRS
jgi:hypothetical protein